MKLNRSFVTLSVVGVLGMGLLLTGCGGDTGTNGSTSSQDAAKQQFLNRPTPGPDSGTPGVGGRPPGVFGSITSISGNQIKVKSQTDGTETVVQPGDSATIGKQAAAQASDITQGVTVAATGTMTGGVLDAQVVQIGGGNFIGFGGGGFGGGGRGGFNGTPGAGRGGFNGTPGAGGQRFRGTPGPNGSGTPGAGRNFAVGTVAKVDGNTITLNMANGSTGTFTISSTTRFMKNVTIQLTDLQVGDNIVAVGQQNGNVFTATSIQVVTGFGGNGGGGNTQPGQTPTP